MAKKIILRIVLPLLVFILASYSVFWFIKAGEVKNNIRKILTSNPKSSVGKISSSGFPLAHRIRIENVNVEFDNQSTSGSMIVNEIIAESKVFSNQFTASIIGDVVLKASDGKISTIKFNENPLINFVVEDYNINKVSYADEGYKVLDNSNNEIFSAGNAKIDLKIDKDQNLQTISLKANFNNLSSFDVFSLNTDNEAENLLLKTTDIKEVQNGVAVTKIDEKNPAALPNELPKVDLMGDSTSNGEVKDVKMKTNKNGAIDIKFVSTIDEKTKATLIKDVTINNIELFSPLYKININGVVNNFLSQDQNIDLTIKVKNIDNILLYLKKFISSMIPANYSMPNMDTPIVSKVDASSVVAVSPLPDSSNAVNGQDSTVIPATTNTTPEEMITNLILDLAKNNPNSNAETAEFKITGKDVMFDVNGVSGPEIIKRLTPVIDIFNKSFSGEESGITTQGSGLILEDEIKNGQIGSPPLNQPVESQGSAETPAVNNVNSDEKANSAKEEIKKENNSSNPSKNNPKK